MRHPWVMGSWALKPNSQNGPRRLVVKCGSGPPGLQQHPALVVAHTCVCPQPACKHIQARRSHCVVERGLAKQISTMQGGTTPSAMQCGRAMQRGSHRGHACGPALAVPGLPLAVRFSLSQLLQL